MLVVRQSQTFHRSWRLSPFSPNNTGDEFSMKKKFSKTGTLEEKFWERVNRTGPVPPEHPELGNCQIWIGNISPTTGYGRIRLARDRSSVDAHRFSWLIQIGEIPTGLCVLHHCDVRFCVRIEHLFLGTKGDNNKDCVAKGRNQRGEAHGNAKLTWDNVRRIRELRANGALLTEIAHEFGVCFGTVSQVCLLKIWKETLNNSADHRSTHSST